MARKVGELASSLTGSGDEAGQGARRQAGDALSRDGGGAGDGEGCDGGLHFDELDSECVGEAKTKCCRSSGGVGNEWKREAE